MTLYGHTNQVSTIQGVIVEGDDGKLWKLLLGMVEMSGWQGPHYPVNSILCALDQLSLGCDDGAGCAQNGTTDTCCFDAGFGPTQVSCPRPNDECPLNGHTDCNGGCLYEVRHTKVQDL